jgi:hypothetical protein
MRGVHEDLQERVKAEYRARNDRLGWRLFSCPCANVLTSGIVFLGLNPGGTRATSDHGEYSCEDGSAYEIESWLDYPAGKAPLQRQVRSLFQLLNVKPHDVLSGNLIPFRSKSFADLGDSDGALRFGTAIWSEVLPLANRQLVIGMGQVVQDMLFKHYCATVSETKAGWGNQKIRYAVVGQTRIVGLPHLSRFGVATRKESKEFLIAALGM